MQAGSGRGEPPDPSVPPAAGDTADGARRQARVRLAVRLATELCDLPPAVWAQQAVGAAISQLARVDDDATLADIVAEAWDLTRVRPLPQEQVTWRSGPAGLVVVAHGAWWSVVARASGPLLVLSEAFEDVVRLQESSLGDGELDALVTGLVSAAKGLPPADWSQLPPPPPVPGHRGD
jgi:hypothetical protein